MPHPRAEPAVLSLRRLMMLGGRVSCAEGVCEFASRSPRAAGPLGFEPGTPFGCWSWCFLARPFGHVAVPCSSRCWSARFHCRTGASVDRRSRRLCGCHYLRPRMLRCHRCMVFDRAAKVSALDEVVVNTLRGPVYASTTGFRSCRVRSADPVLSTDSVLE